MKNSKTSDMRHKVDIYEQIDVEEDDEIKPKWRYCFSIWCSVTSIFREFLEYKQLAGDTLRNRLVFETHYRDDVTTRNRLVYEGKMYSISIAGDTSGKHDRIRIIAEDIEDAGA